MPESVLLVEDEEFLRESLARHLRGHGVATTTAATAAEATAILARGLRPSLVLLDLNLPDESGWDLLRGPLGPGPDRPPVVVVSALTVAPRRLREFGVAGYLPKPFAPATLLDLVERQLGRNVPSAREPTEP
jgi:DNA-binding response OmpR family regulator